MKNAANCVKYGELQGSRNRNMSNAYGASNIAMLGARLSEGLLKFMTIFGERVSKVAEFTGLGALLDMSRCQSAPRASSRYRVPEGARAFASWVPCGLNVSDTTVLYIFHLWTSDQARLPAKFKHII